MPSTLDLRRRIRSVKNTQQITRAMKMVAAAKLRRAQDRLLAARPYAGALPQMLQSVASRVDAETHPLLQRRQEKNVLLLVVTGDKGL
ncbi:MAG TPA: F0F1 ATP synthase subunit gamma, partial [Thermoanaerobaculia bacterium]